VLGSAIDGDGDGAGDEEPGGPDAATDVGVCEAPGVVGDGM
jgi:hypothetical protein